MSWQTDRVRMLEDTIASLRKIQAKLVYFMDDEKKASKEYRDLSQEFLNRISTIYTEIGPNPEQLAKEGESSFLGMSSDEGRHYNILNDLHKKIQKRVDDAEAELAREKKAVKEYDDRRREGAEKKYRKPDGFSKFLDSQLAMEHSGPPDPRELWKKACEYDGIPPDSKFVTFSKDNPYAKLYNEALNAEAEFGKPSYHHVEEEPSYKTGKTLEEELKGRAYAGYDKEAGPEMYTNLTLGYEGVKNRVYSLANELHPLAKAAIKQQGLNIDEGTIEKWSSVTIVEKARYYYMDIQNTRFEVNKDNYDVTVRGEKVGNLRTITAQDMFGAM